MFLRFTSKFNKLKENHYYETSDPVLVENVREIEEKLRSFERDISFTKDESKKLSMRLHTGSILIRLQSWSISGLGSVIWLGVSMLSFPSIGS